MEIDLSGRTALVTGGSGELGRVMVRTLARCGADVAVHFHGNRAKAEALVEELHALGRRSVAVQADVTDMDSVLAMRDFVFSELGRVDTIVNNAVVQYDWAPILAQSPEDYEGQFRSCVMQSVLMAKAFVPSMVERGFGRVIGINSECSMQYMALSSAYVSGKRGMDGVLRCLAREVGEHGVTVNQVAPGRTKSDKDTSPDYDVVNGDYIRAVPLRRCGKDQEIANVVAFLASDLASFVTGAFVPVCGGNVMPAI